MKALRHTEPQKADRGAFVGGWVAPPTESEEGMEGAKTARRRSGRRSLVVFRCRALASIVSPSVRCLVLHRIRDGWAAPSYE